VSTTFSKSSTLPLGDNNNNNNNNNSGSVCAAAWSFDGQVIASGGHDSRIMLWDVKKGERLTELKGHSKHNKDCTCKFDEDDYPACPVQEHR
jgi:WD40 repeat protein